MSALVLVLVLLVGCSARNVVVEENLVGGEVVQRTTTDKSKTVGQYAATGETQVGSADGAYFRANLSGVTFGWGGLNHTSAPEGEEVRICRDVQFDAQGNALGAQSCVEVNDGGSGN